MKTFFLVKGFGEYAQAYAVAVKLKEEHCEIHFLCENPFIQQIIVSDGFDLLSFTGTDELKKIVSTLSGEALFLCNSHTTYTYGLSRPDRIKKIFTLESNWYFNDAIYPYKNYSWVDTHYVVFPKEYFLSNLKENGGYFEIDPLFNKKIYTPGFVPAEKKLSLQEKLLVRREHNISDDAHLVCVYHSSPQVLKNHPFSSFREALVIDIELIIRRLKEISNREIVMINLSNKTEATKIFQTSAFDKLIISSDLVVMHHGYGTLPKLFHNEVPIISFTEIPQNTLYASYYEIQPAVKSGAIKHFFYENYKKEELESSVSSLLFDTQTIVQMKKNQQSIFVDGIDDLLHHFHLQIV